MNDDQSPTPRSDAQAPPESSSSRHRLKRRLQILGLVFGVAMVTLAIIMVAREQETLQEAWQSIRRPDPLPLILLPLAVLANLVLSALVFRLLISRFGKVGWIEMQAVIAAAALVNFIPLRPGLAGRLFYHRAVNKIPLMHSGRTVIEAVVITLGTGGYLALAAMATIRFELNLWVATAMPIPLLGILALWPPARLWCAAILLRYAEIAVWGVRYACAFSLIGSPISPEAALALACVSVLATMMPLFSNGLGLREWAVGLLAPLLAATTLEVGLVAELVNRAAEILMVTLVGLAALTYISRRTANLPAET